MLVEVEAERRHQVLLVPAVLEVAVLARWVHRGMMEQLTLEVVEVGVVVAPIKTAAPAAQV
jgi:hypothetical protein